MSISTPLYHQLLGLLSQHSQYRDFRHLKALAWMINALICSSKINLSEWESYVVSRATQAQSFERRWQRFVHNSRVKVKSIYVPLVQPAKQASVARRDLGAHALRSNEKLERATPLFSIGYNSSMESLLYDPSFRNLWR